MMRFDRLAIGTSVLASLLTFVTFFLTDASADSLTREDGPIENLTMVAFAAAFVVASWHALRSHGVRRCYFVLWAALSLIFFGEETSWLQRFFSFKTPELLAANVQGESNLHNMPLLSPKVVNSPLDLVTSQGLFYLGFAVYFLALPLALRLVAPERIPACLSPVRLSDRLLMAIWVPIGLSFVLALLTENRSTRDALTEVREFFFALAIWGYVLSLVASRKQPPQEQSAEMSARSAVH